MTCQGRYEKAKELKLCFCCLAGKHAVKDCTYKACGVEGCSRRHHQLLHRDANGRPKDSGLEDPEANSAFCSLESSGSRKKASIDLGVVWLRSKPIVHRQDISWKLKAHGEEIDLSVAGIHGTNDVKCEQDTMAIRDKTKGDTHYMTVYTHSNIDAEQRSTTIRSSNMLIHACRF